MLATAKAAGPQHGATSAAPQRQPDGFVDHVDTAIGLPRYLGIQAKLEIGSRDDPLEREADALARAARHHESPHDASHFSSSLTGTGPAAARLLPSDRLLPHLFP